MVDYKTSTVPSSVFQTAFLGCSPEEQKSSPLDKKMVTLSSADIIPPPQRTDPVIFTSSFVRPLSGMPVNVESRLPTMFGRVQERCVTFCIDTSGSMFYALDIVKDHLIETLSMLAEQDDNRLFNIIEFNTDVTKWSSKMVHCTREAVAAAKQWISNLAVKTGTNTHDALFAALDDPACQAVYLVTDDIPDRYPEEVVNNIVDVCGRCRIHCIYISCEKINEDVVDFLEDLAVETCGSIQIVTLTCHGCLDRITPIYRADHSRRELARTLKYTLQSSLKACSIPTTLQFDPEVMLGLSAYPKSSIYNPLVYWNTRPHSLKPYNWSKLHSRNISLKEDVAFRNPLLNFSSAAGSLLAGKRVIARRKQDGYFYRATIKNQISSDTFLVAFRPCRHYNLYQTEYEDVSLFDIVDCTTTQNQAISTGDRVMAPCDKEEDRFAPAIVVTGQVRQTETCLAKSTVAVCFNDGQVKQASEDAVVFIPPVVYEKFTQEKEMSAVTTKNHPAIDYTTSSMKGHSVSPLAVKSSSYPWNSVTYKHPSILPVYFGNSPFIINQKEGLVQSMINNIPYNLALPLGIGVTDMKNQGETQKYQPNYEERPPEIVDDKMYPERAVTFCKSPRLLARKEKQKEGHLRNHAQFNTNKTKIDSKPEEINSFGDFSYGTDSKPEEINSFGDFSYGISGSQIQKMYSGKGDDFTEHFIPSPGYENEKTWNKVLLRNHSPCSSELSVSPTEKVKNSSCLGPISETTHRSSLKMNDQKLLCNEVNDHSMKLNAHSTSHNRNLTNMTPGERIQINTGRRFGHLYQPKAQHKERKGSVKAHQQDDRREIILSHMEKDRHNKIQEQVNFQQTQVFSQKRSIQS